MIIELDNTLSQIVNRNDNEFNYREIDRINRKCFSDGANEFNYKTRITTVTEKAFATSLTQDKSLYHLNYLEYLQSTFASHYNIVLAPQNIWFDLVSDFAQIVVKNSDQYRSLFTRAPQGKIDIVIPCSNEAEPLRINDIYKCLIDLVPIDTKIFLPEFSCSTDKSKSAILGAFLETCSPFYNYMMLACGHPRIKLLGTNEDWEILLNAIHRLNATVCEKADQSVVNWLENYINTVTMLNIAWTKQDSDFFRKMFTQQRCGSGSQYDIDGWYSKLWYKQPTSMREVCNFAPHISKVPYTTLPSGTEWNLCFGLFSSTLDNDGFYVPDYDWVQIQKLKTPIEMK